MTRFYEFRIHALNFWIDNTNRVITDKYSDIKNADLVAS
jgi:hypothetical protein